VTRQACTIGSWYQLFRTSSNSRRRRRRRRRRKKKTKRLHSTDKTSSLLFEVLKLK